MYKITGHIYRPYKDTLYQLYPNFRSAKKGLRYINGVWPKNEGLKITKIRKFKWMFIHHKCTTYTNHRKTPKKLNGFIYILVKRYKNSRGNWGNF